MVNRLTQTLDFQAQALMLRSERQRLLASNIANADTPGYVARDMNFAAALREATGGQGAPGSLTVSTSSLSAGAGLGLSATKSGHLGASPAVAGRPMASASSTYNFALASQNSIDRNSVDMDRERASFADNSVRYEAALRFINGSVRTMLDAIKGQSQ